MNGISGPSAPFSKRLVRKLRLDPTVVYPAEVIHPTDKDRKRFSFRAEPSAPEAESHPAVNEFLKRGIIV